MKDPPTVYKEIITKKVPIRDPYPIIKKKKTIKKVEPLKVLKPYKTKKIKPFKTNEKIIPIKKDLTILDFSDI